MLMSLDIVAELNVMYMKGDENRIDSTRHPGTLERELLKVSENERMGDIL